LGLEGLHVITFNDILRSEGIDVTHVRLVRHLDTGRRDPTIYAAWRSPNGRQLVEEYQRIQARRVFHIGDIVASFVVTPRPRPETLFLGLYHVTGVNLCGPDARDPIYGNNVAGLHRYDLTRDKGLAQYVDRLSIDWGRGTRAWVQSAARQPKAVRALMDREDPPFPGFSQFCIDVDEVPGLYASWQQRLREVKGIYVLVDKDTGHQYIGSAKGEESLLARFMAYAATGHGGNVELRRRKAARYQVGVLEIVNLALPDRRIEEIEAWWKRKLLTREFGLNRN
jgi:hypothetical protein